MFLTAQETKTINRFCRQAVYFWLAVIAIISLYFLADKYQTTTFQEFGIVENIQLGLLIISAGVFTIEALIFKNMQLCCTFWHPYAL